MPATTTNNLGRKKRKTRQRVKERYAKAREDAQLAGVIHTVPEGAVREERVDPIDQEEQDLIGLDVQAATKGWASSEAVKRQVVNALAEVFFEPTQTVVDRHGNVLTLSPDRQLQVKAANALLTADQREYERTHPKEAGQAKGASPVNVQVNFFEMVARAAQVDRADDVEQKIQVIEQAGVKDDAG